MTLAWALLLGVAIGLSLGALGGGGSILTVPALVYVLGEPARAATTGSLVIVGVTALISALGHARAGNVRWGPGLTFGAIGVVSSVFGTQLNKRIDANLLLLAFAALMLVAAGAMLRRARARRPAPPAPPERRPAGPAGVQTLARPAPAPARTDRARALRVALAGLVVGFLTGFLGVGGGFIVVPALVMSLGYPMPIAVGTSLLVIGINSFASLAERAGSASFHWSVIVPFTLAAIAGLFLGRGLAGRVSATSLTRAFAGLLIAVGLYVAIRSGIGFAG